MAGFENKRPLALSDYFILLSGLPLEEPLNPFWARPKINA